MIIASDILEHVKDDSSALNEWNRILKTGGKLIVFVPAFNLLWSNHDEICHHYRRYSQASLISNLERANFEVDKISYWNFCLFFPVSAVRISQRVLFKSKIQKSDQLYELNPIINNILTYLLRFENWLLNRLGFPVGTSVFAVARK